MLDWNPNDPDTVKVHYDVSSWTIDQRAELAEALAEADIAHVWEGDEVVVPEELEAEVDELFARLEELLGPFPVALGDDDPGVEYGLDEWPPGDRQTLTQALIEAEVPHRWDGTTVIVATDAEPTVDELLDAIEQGTLVLSSGPAGGDRAGGRARHAVHVVGPPGPRPRRRRRPRRADRARRRRSNRRRRRTACRSGRGPRRWSRRPSWPTSSTTTDSTSSDIIGAAQSLRALVRQYV